MLPHIKHILYATDLSDNARQVLGYAVLLANSLEASLTVIHVIEKTSPKAELMIQAFLGYRSKEEMQKQSRDKLSIEIKAELKKMCDELGCELPSCRFTLSNIIVEFGSPGEILLGHAESGSYDFIVAGRYDYGLIDWLFMGHSAKGMLRHSPIPLLQIPFKSRDM